MLRSKSRLLQRRFERLVPTVGWDTAYTWAGTFGESKDGLAYIGETPEYPHAYFALAYGGNGISFGVIAAGIIRDLYLGRPNADTAIFRFGR
jgi:glycine/D-amino acid oxidase-like deaminating enzyme